MLWEYGEVNVEPGAFSGLSVGYHKAMMIIHYFFNNGKANAGAIEFFFIVQAPEDLEYPFIESVFKANPVIFYRQVVIPAMRLQAAGRYTFCIRNICRNFYPGGSPCPCKFQ